jgi:hypothetical protein
MKTLVNFAGFQLGWFACVLAAAAGQAWLGVVAVAAIVALHLAWTRRPRAAPEARLLGLAAAGCLLEGANVALGVYVPAGGLGVASPLFYAWMAAFWINFAATLNVSMAWLRGRPALAAGFGAVGGPAAFFAAEKLGALTLSPDALFALGALGLEWAIATPLLLAVAARLVDQAVVPAARCCEECGL